MKYKTSDDAENKNIIFLILEKVEGICSFNNDNQSASLLTYNLYQTNQFIDK